MSCVFKFFDFFASDGFLEFMGTFGAFVHGYGLIISECLIKVNLTINI